MHIDFDVLKKQGSVVREKKYEDEEEALLAYKELHEALSLNRELTFGRSGESFDFRLGITISSPYIITIEIFLV